MTWGLNGSGKNACESPIYLAETGFIYKKSQQITHMRPGNAQPQLSALNYGSLISQANLEKYYGPNNRLLNG